MSSSICCLLTCIQVSQEAGQVVWYSHLFQNFQFVMIHIVKDYGTVNKVEIDVFLKLSFSNDPVDVGIKSLVPLPFLKPAWTFGSSRFTYYWSLAWRILSNSQNWNWGWNENWCFPVLWPLLSFPNLLAYWMQHFHSIIFSDLKYLNWNSIISTSFVHSDAF